MFEAKGIQMRETIAPKGEREIGKASDKQQRKKGMMQHTVMCKDETTEVRSGMDCVALGVSFFTPSVREKGTTHTSLNPHPGLQATYTQMTASSYYDRTYGVDDDASC